MPPVKHFLDTSVVRAWLLGTKMQRDYFRAQFDGGKCYICRFVLMEFLRSFVRSTVDFCLHADMPQFDSVADALAFWSNKYKGSEHKAVEQLIASIANTQMLDWGNRKDKKKIVIQLAYYVERIVLRIESSFTDTGIDSTRCARSAIKFEVDTAAAMKSLADFAISFDKTADFAKKCRVGEFVTKRFKTEVEAYIAAAEGLPKTNPNNGFIGVCSKLKEVITKGTLACNCRCCGSIGDAVIALDAPRNMRLEHIDQSFNHLCPPINQPHQEHPSASALLKKP